MRNHRYFVEQPLGEDVVLRKEKYDDVVGALIHQWISVLRYKKGDFLILFNGNGFDYVYECVSLSKNEVCLQFIKSSLGVKSVRNCYLFVSCIKKDLFELVVQKSTELGISRIIPISSEHTERTSVDFERLKRICKEACEQSGRSSLLTIEKKMSLFDALIFLKERDVSPANTFVASLQGKPAVGLLNNTISCETIAFFVGPEGGWSEFEENLFKEKNFSCVSLGVTTLRAETAGIICAFLSTII